MKTYPSVLATLACGALFGTAAHAQGIAAEAVPSRTTVAIAHAKGAAALPTEGPWMVRLRLLSMSNADLSAPFTIGGTSAATSVAHANDVGGTSIPANAIHVSDKVFPEVDVTYFITRQWSTELILTYPQDHAVSVAGVGNIGTIRHLPPCLTVQYHYPIKKSRFTPYIGAGVNFTWITSSNLAAAGIPLDVSRTSFGLVTQIGVDYSLGKHLYLNFDYKHINLNPDLKIKATGAHLSNVEVNPDLLSVGVGYRF